MKSVPVVLNEHYDVTIESLSHKGLGVARIDGFLVFVRNAWMREEMSIRIDEIKKNFAFASAVELYRVAKERKDPECPVFEACGGCQLQHVSYEGQLAFKKDLVVKQLKKIAHIDEPPVLDVIGMENPWRYRNKTGVHVAYEDDQVKAGFFANKSHTIVDSGSCLIQTEVADKIVAYIKAHATDDFLRHVVIRVGFESGEVMVIFVTKTWHFPHKKEFVADLKAQFPMIQSIAQTMSHPKNAALLTNEMKVIDGNDYIQDAIGGLNFLISPKSFYQINPPQTKKLYDTVLDFATLSPNDIVFDAYCGVGSITLFLATQAKHVYGVEIIPDAIADAWKNADLNEIKNVSFEVGAAEMVIPKWIEAGTIPDVIVVDPPRKGCDVDLLDAIIRAKPRRVVYVSCDVATLSRDIKILTDGGFQLDKVQPVDMFAHTSHIECVALLTYIG